MSLSGSAGNVSLKFSNAQLPADLFKVMFQLFSAVLHYPAGVGQRYNLAKKFQLGIEPLQVSKVFSVAQAVTFFGACPQRHLLHQAFYNKGLKALFQVFIVVIVEIFSVFHKTERTYGANKIMFVKRFGAAHILNEPVYELRGEFRFFFKRIGNAAGFFQLNGVGKRNTRYAGAKPPGVDAKDEPPFPVVAVKLAVKFPTGIQRFR